MKRLSVLMLAILAVSVVSLVASESKLLAATSYTLTVSVSAAPNGTVTSSPAGINCGGTCSASFASGTAVTLTMNPNPGHIVEYWGVNGGGCPSFSGYPATTCTITMNDNTSAIAYIGNSNITVHVSSTGTGAGTVTSSPAGINCGGTCSASFPTTFPSASSVTLTAIPSSGSTFTGWQTSGDACFNSGPGVPNTVNTDPTCNMGYTSDASSITVVPQFNQAASSSPTSTSHSNSSSSTTSSSSSSSSSYGITLPNDLSLTLWNGSNFGQSGQAFVSSSSSSAQVGIADKSNVPLALVSVDLSKAQDWSKTAITYASSVTAHEAFMHGLTSAPGVVGSTFTLYVPYATADKYVGVCPDASSLSVLGPNCPNLYYLMNGQSRTNKDDSNIPSGATVTASVVTINTIKYWSISGLTGTGGFSSSTNTKSSASPTTAIASTQNKAKNSQRGLYAGMAAVIVLVALGATYKLWLPKLKLLRHTGNVLSNSSSTTMRGEDPSSPPNEDQNLG